MKIRLSPTLSRSNRVLTRRAAAGALIAVAAISGCAPSPFHLPERPIVDGGTVASLVSRSDTAIVLLYRPSDAFVCSGSLQPWLEWRRSHPGSFALVFTREPTRAERTQLATHHIRADGVLRREMLDAVDIPPAPAELLLVRGWLVSIGRVRPRALRSALYQRMASPTRS